MSDHDSTFQSLTPYLRYPDGDEAVHWLSRVFGFGPASAVRDDSGRWYEGDLAVGDHGVAIGGGASVPSGGYVIIGVPDADEMYRRVRAAGVEADEPEDKPYGPRTVAVTDPWGVTWDFWQGEAVL
jgi:uncharacterized glyoxalase superfamily protein PhnB